MAINIPDMRKAISAALEVSIKEFQAKPDFAKAIENNDCRVIDRFKWIYEAGKKSISDLNTFWQHMNRYSGNRSLKYLQVCIFPLRNCAIAGQGHAAETLEQLWTWLRNREQTYHHGIIIICTKKTGFEDASQREIQIATPVRLSQHFPSSETICRSAIVASLFLIMHEFGFGLNDMHDLMTTILGEKITEDSGLLPDLPKANLCPKVTQNGTQGVLGSQTTYRARWHSIRSNSVLPTLFTTTQTKTIVFPGSFPPFKTTWQYMNIYKPHSSIPSSGSACGVWGAWNTDYTAWNCVAAVRDPEIADDFSRGLLEVFSVASPSVLSGLLSHWAEMVQYLYTISLNDSLLAVRDALKVVHTIKYQNASDPETGSAHLCLMYINYMEYYQRLVNRLRREIEEFPPAWRVVSKPAWTTTMVETCHSVEADLAVALAEAKEVRNMIIQQYSLSQARKTGLLTILASIFVPMSFVATFFGMNTKEMNDSAWPLRYYAIAAASLTAITLFVPLLGLQSFSATAKLLGSSASLRRTIKWSWIVLTFGLNLTIDIVASTTEGRSFNGAFFPVVHVLCSVVAGCYLSLLLASIRRALSGEQSLLFVWKKERQNILFYMFTCLCFLIGWYVQRFIELTPYVFYFGKRLYTVLRKRYGHKRYRRH